MISLRRKGLCLKKWSFFGSRKPFTGCSVDYYNNGQLRSKSNFKDGLKDGICEYFDEDGNLTKTEELAKEEDLINRLSKLRIQ